MKYISTKLKCLMTGGIFPLASLRSHELADILVDVDEGIERFGGDGGYFADDVLLLFGFLVVKTEDVLEGVHEDSGLQATDQILLTIEQAITAEE